MDRIKTDNPHLKRVFILSVIVMGFSGMIAQIVILRELLVTFLGNELSIGIILANWLILEASGSYFLGRTIEKRHRKLELYVIVSLVFTASLPVILYFSRDVRILFGLSPGEGIDALQMVLFSLLILMPVSVTHGALFTFACRIGSELLHTHEPHGDDESREPGSRITGRIYVLEVVGTAAGGVGFTYILLPAFHSFQIVSGVVLLNLVVSLFLLLLIRRPNFLSLIPASLVIGALLFAGFITFSGRMEKIHWSSIKRAWRGIEVIHYENSPYGNITVTRMGEQLTFYSDGVPAVTIPTPDIACVENFVHFPLLYHPAPEDVLVISGGAGGVIGEIGKHPVKRIDYVELDPLVLDVMDRFSSPEAREEWRNPLVKVYRTDGRHRLRFDETVYDLILVGMTDPADLQINRFFSLEFFSLAQKRLKDGGIISVSLPGSLAYLSDEQRNLNACIWETLREIFIYVYVIPGETNLFFASSSLDFSRLGPAELKKRMSERGLELNLITPFYIDYRLQEEKRNWFLDAIKDTDVELNRDNHPSGVYYSLSIWTAKFSPYLLRLFNRLGKIRTGVFAVFCAVLTIALVLLRLFAPKSLAAISIPFSIGTTGFCAMLFDLSIVFAFQVLHGSLYQKVGLLITAFLCGTGLGAFLITAALRTIKRDALVFLLLESGVTIVALLLLLLFFKALGVLAVKASLTTLEILFPCIGLLSGLVVGAEFPLAVRIFHRINPSFAGSVGLLNASDLAGGWLGGMLGGVFLLPVLGLGYTCIVLVMLKLTAIASLVLVRRRGRFPVGGC